MLCFVTKKLDSEFDMICEESIKVRSLVRKVFTSFLTWCKRERQRRENYLNICFWLEASNMCVFDIDIPFKKEAPIQKIKEGYDVARAYLLTAHFISLIAPLHWHRM